MVEVEPGVVAEGITAYVAVGTAEIQVVRFGVVMVAVVAVADFAEGINADFAVPAVANAVDTANTSSLLPFEKVQTLSSIASSPSFYTLNPTFLSLCFSNTPSLAPCCSLRPFFHMLSGAISPFHPCPCAFLHTQKKNHPPQTEI